jgi:hypothetical protein
MALPSHQPTLGPVVAPRPARIRLRAVRRCGQLIKEFAKAKKQHDARARADTHPSRKDAADKAGLSDHQRKQAIRVAKSQPNRLTNKWRATSRSPSAPWQKQDNLGWQATDTRVNGFDNCLCPIRGQVSGQRQLRQRAGNCQACDKIGCKLWLTNQLRHRLNRANIRTVGRIPFV